MSESSGGFEVRFGAGWPTEVDERAKVVKLRAAEGKAATPSIKVLVYGYRRARQLLNERGISLPLLPPKQDECRRLWRPRERALGLWLELLNKGEAA